MVKGREEIAERTKQSRQMTAQQLRSAKNLAKLGLAVAVEISSLKDVVCCEYCRSQNGRIIPLAHCTLDMLPPFRKCTNREDGCRCGIPTVMAEEQSHRPKPRAGRGLTKRLAATALVLVVVATVILLRCR
jgi:hypothetical protein